MMSMCHIFPSNQLQQCNDSTESFPAFFILAEKYLTIPDVPQAPEVPNHGFSLFLIARRTTVNATKAAVNSRKQNPEKSVEEEEPTGYIRFEKFLPVMTEILLERRYRPIPEDILLRAFEVLDPSKRGFLLKEELIKYMTEEGEPFSQEEMEEMLSAAIDPESNSVHYKDYIAMMVIDES
ncbi:dynein regulatory complex protein 8 isoform X1 [Felis catus]|uniref:EF-hand domain-containing protein n=1 Tax=Felis catus TaxID=9685 RepID=A0ABI7WLE6_FELCA|nr:dynein regulatory complex protein 8 isoform X1 [Felis catus]